MKKFGNSKIKKSSIRLVQAESKSTDKDTEKSGKSIKSKSITSKSKIRKTHKKEKSKDFPGQAFQSNKASARDLLKQAHSTYMLSDEPQADEFEALFFQTIQENKVEKGP